MNAHSLTHDQASKQPHSTRRQTHVIPLKFLTGAALRRRGIALPLSDILSDDPTGSRVREAMTPEHWRGARR